MLVPPASSHAPIQQQAVEAPAVALTLSQARAVHAYYAREAAPPEPAAADEQRSVLDMVIADNDNDDYSAYCMGESDDGSRDAPTV